MDIIRFDTTETFVRTSVRWIAATILQAQHDGRTAVIGLSGGSTPKPVYVMLAAELGIDWNRVTFFLVDERYVPKDHADSNQRMIRETLLTHHAAEAATVFPDTSLPLPLCVSDYEQKISALHRADLVIMGMGDDGHIASLFPPIDPKAYGPAKTMHTTTESFAVRDRITVTLPVLLHAAKRLFLVTGEKKSTLLTTMQKSNEDVSIYPAQYLFDAKTTWMVVV